MRQRSLLVSLKSHHIAWYQLCLVSLLYLHGYPISIMYVSGTSLEGKVGLMEVDLQQNSMDLGL